MLVADDVHAHGLGPRFHDNLTWILYMSKHNKNNNENKIKSDMKIMRRWEEDSENSR